MCEVSSKRRSRTRGHMTIWNRFWFQGGRFIRIKYSFSPLYSFTYEGLIYPHDYILKVSHFSCDFCLRLVYPGYSACSTSSNSQSRRRAPTNEASSKKWQESPASTQ